MEYTNELRIKTTHYLITGFSLVVGLSWNEFIKKVIENVFPLDSDVIYAKFAYCLLITFLLVVFVNFMPSTDKELPKPVQKQLAAVYREPNPLYIDPTGDPAVPYSAYQLDQK
jgi:hypothetical protein